MRKIVLGVRRATTIKEPARTVEIIQPSQSRTVVVKDVCRKVSFSVPQRRLSVIRQTDREVSFVQPVRKFSVVQGRNGRDGTNGAGAETFGPFIAGEAIASSSLAHIALADGKVYLADYELDRPANCFSISGFAEGATLSVYRSGLLNGLGGIDPGREYWLGNAGQLRTTCPNHGVTQRCGTGASATEVIVSLFEDVDWE